MLTYHIRQFSEAASQQITETGDIDPSRVVQVRGPDIPGNLDEVNSALPVISQAEAAALLIQFLRAERGGIVAGARINILHWLIICGVYAPERERYTSLRELVEIGDLASTSDATLYVPSDLKWPLILTSVGAANLEEMLHVRRHVPTFWKAKASLAAWLRAVPLLGDVIRKRIGG